MKTKCIANKLCQSTLSYQDLFGEGVELSEKWSKMELLVRSHTNGEDGKAVYLAQPQFSAFSTPDYSALVHDPFSLWPQNDRAFQSPQPVRNNVSVVKCVSFSALIAWKQIWKKTMWY